MKDFLEGLVTGIIFLMLFFSLPGLAFAVENNDFGNDQVAVTTTVQEEDVIRTDYKCDVSSLTPEESRKIMDLTGENFEGEEVGDGSGEKATGLDLDGLELIGQDISGSTAVKQEPPTQAASADRFCLFDGREISGPFGIGLVLDDTMRVGRCVDTAQENCRIYGYGLSFRTSGKGIKNFFIDTSSEFKDFISKGVTGVSEEEYIQLQNQVYDLDDSKVLAVQLDPTDQIPNSFVTENYTVKNATTCDSSACSISTYSSFDKLYNSWFSADLIVTSFGPTLLHSAGRVLNLASSGPGGGIFAGNKVFSGINDRITRMGNFIRDAPSAIVGKKRIDNYQQLITKHGIGDYFTEFTVGGKAFSSGAQGYVDALLGKNSPLWDLTPEQKKAFFRALDDVRAYSRVSKLKLDAAKEAFKAKEAAARAAGRGVSPDDTIQYSREVAKIITDWDDNAFLDFPAWIQKNHELTGLQGFAVKRSGFPEGMGYVDVTSAQPFNFTNGILKPFSETGGWEAHAGATTQFGYAFELTDTVSEATGRHGLQLFKAQPSSVVARNASVTDLTEYVAKLGDTLYTVNIPGHGQMPLNAATVDFIKNSPGVLGNVDIYASTYAPAAELFPEDFANIILNDRIVGRTGTAHVNYSNLYTGLKQKPEFVSRRSLSELDYFFSKEGEIIRDYFTLRANKPSFYKATLGPAVAWNFKSGLGSEKWSAYMLPDSWTTMTVSQGVDEIYNNSFIDFFANEGSDQGDLFGRMINNMVFFPNYLLKEAADMLSPNIGDWVRTMSGERGLKGSLVRDEVMDIAFYSHNENCSGCSVNIGSEQDYLRFNISSNVNLKSFIVEAVDSSTAEEKGTTLIAYAYNSNISGQTSDVPAGEINLVRARQDGHTCDQVLRELNLGWAGDMHGFVPATLVSVSYFVHPGVGLIAAGAHQLLISPKLQNCVDDKEGYYIHFYSPPSEVRDAYASREQLANENVTKTIDEMNRNLTSLLSEENPVADSFEKIKKDFKDFSEQATKKDILQATIDMLPPISGSLSGKQIFYIWYKDMLVPSALKTEGQSVLKDGNVSVVKDFGQGDLIIDGEKVVEDKKEIVGLTTQDNRIPAEIVPKDVSVSSVPKTEEIIFELNSLGELRVREEYVLKCIQEAIEKQTGITYSGNELTQVFGNLKSINTQKYGKVFTRDNQIHLEGSGPRVYGTAQSRFVINGYWDSTLIQDVNRTVDAGKFKGMAFENGSIVLNPETDEIVIWLRQHKESILSTKEVSGLEAKLGTAKDPITDCDYPVIDLEAKGYSGDELGLVRVGNFNKSMEKMGPFSQFITDDRIYEFYSELDSETGECIDYFRVIDKETGQVIVDSPIVGGIRQDAEGKISFQTADGKTHTLDFKTDQGVPKIVYNDGIPETLRSAQGVNGSFWFDPNTGLWYPENSMQIPLNQAFKDQGAFYGADKEGNVTGSPTNPMTFNIGQQAPSGFNIPSLPETTTGIVLFISMFLMISFMITQKVPKRKSTKKS